MQRIAMVAGELSGDVLGAGLIQALKRRHAGLRIEGIGGPAMRAAGLHSLYPMEALSIMGLAEVLRHLPRLVALRHRLVCHFRDHPPEVFIGIDSPDFNLGLERCLRTLGVPTAHYVSPSVWAWRRSRIKRIAQSVDLMLTLLPFEPPYYRAQGVPVVFVGHPTADRYGFDLDAAQFRSCLGLSGEGPVLAVLPGSRQGEVARIGPIFAATVAQLVRRQPELQLIAAMATPGLRRLFQRQLEAVGLSRCRLIEDNAKAVMGAADVVLAASGTATLEAMLLQRPMVVAYRVAPITAGVIAALRLIKTRYFALPNLLADEALVPEYIQGKATPQNLTRAVEDLLADPERASYLRQRFRQLHGILRCNANERAADALEQLVSP
ncbi:lipid-A-disaccharide synthase [Nitrococcus mobilis]|uniref:Lipid-A-disaccharide synthase n=1 Tax=Nitrococcus mobilis Nb-231 TaxID=314278 RepID=A4BS35_9GAMM|nr:lipid-A-disaccharide synthase [Nitrococcus mobilis]EAR21514.1 lipid-A-disaccharide synthase [Nitrococcus mobilis Nb-231]